MGSNDDKFDGKKPTPSNNSKYNPNLNKNLGLPPIEKIAAALTDLCLTAVISHSPDKERLRELEEQWSVIRKNYSVLGLAFLKELKEIARRVLKIEDGGSWQFSEWLDKPKMSFVIDSNSRIKIPVLPVRALPEIPYITIESTVSPDKTKFVLESLADYFRACGGAGLEVELLPSEEQA